MFLISKLKYKNPRKFQYSSNQLSGNISCNMRPTTVFILILVAIASIQSKPVFNAANIINTILPQNFPNQLNHPSKLQLRVLVEQAAQLALSDGRTRSVRQASGSESFLENLIVVFTNHPKLQIVFAENIEVAQQVLNSLSISQFYSLQESVVSLVGGVATGNLDASTAVSQFLGQLQQYIGENTQLFNAVVAVAEQALNFKQ
ncbi:hypothetical protein I4U23_005411 [Adineta vaga]|nr:hypothetical protein I4U23_005411 [Adineta vaga]